MANLIIDIHYIENLPEVETFMANEWPSSNKRVFGRELEPAELGKPMIVLVKDSNNILGVAKCKIIGNTVRVLQLLVKSELRGKSGIGKMLLEKIEKICKINKWHKIRLSTSEKHNTIEFYKKQGYFIEAELKNDSFGWTWFIFSKQI